MTGFHAIVAGRNCENWVVRCLDSLASQRRPFDTIQVTDDASTDRTFSTVTNWVGEQAPDVQARVNAVRRGQRLGALRNQCDMIDRANPDPDDVLVFVDLDDRLAHSMVTIKLEAEYARPELDCTYGQYAPSPPSNTCQQARPYPHQVVAQRNYRSFAAQAGGILFNHLRTFRYRVFSQIDRDLNFCWPDGTWFQTCCDTAMMIPVLELAREHRVLDEVLYTYNSINPLSDWRQNAAEIDRTHGYILRTLLPLHQA